MKSDHLFEHCSHRVNPLKSYAVTVPVVSEGAQIPHIMDSAQAAAALTALELALCNKPGLIDMGEQLLAVAEKLC